MANQEALRKCPSCGGPVTESLGLRDYDRWLTSLPGKVSASDLDFFLEQSKSGRALCIEFKEGNKQLGLGQRLLFRSLRQKGIDVWIAWEREDSLLVGEMDMTGEVRFTQVLSEAELDAKVGEWWWGGLSD